MHEHWRIVGDPLVLRDIFDTLVVNWNLVTSQIVESLSDLLDQGLLLAVVLLLILLNEITEEVSQSFLVS